MVVETGESIPMLLQTAKALQQARRLQQRAMLMWALQRQSATRRRNDPALADPTRRNWRLFSRGSVLDD